VQSYDPGRLDPAAKTTHLVPNTQRALAKLGADRRMDRTPLQDVDLTPSQVDDLESFLRSLTDPCVKNARCLAPWIPDQVDGDPDGLRLRAIIPSLTP
jgi:cytochrome c peroxidase